MPPIKHKTTCEKRYGASTFSYDTKESIHQLKTWVFRENPLSRRQNDKHFNYHMLGLTKNITKTTSRLAPRLDIF